jgi:hypothetical protein
MRVVFNTEYSQHKIWQKTSSNVKWQIRMFYLKWEHFLPPVYSLPQKLKEKKIVILTVRWLLSLVLCFDASVSLASECARTGDVAAPAPRSRQVRPLVRGGSFSTSRRLLQTLRVLPGNWTTTTDLVIPASREVKTVVRAPTVAPCRSRLWHSSRWNPTNGICFVLSVTLCLLHGIVFQYVYHMLPYI